MNVIEVLDSLSCVSARTLTLAVRKPQQLRSYIASCLKRYDELAGNGLPSRSPVVPSQTDTISLPATHTGGGMSFAELVIMARVTKTRRPRTIFEMGSYNGLTTAVFVLNAPAGASIYSLDLPPQTSGEQHDLATDKDLVESRALGSIPRALGLNNYTQLLCDSMQFDPTPYDNSIELGLVDAAHDVEHARNDTIKMATMMTESGMVFWHDYAGKGTLRPLARFLESLGRKFPVYRIPETTLAWANAGDLKAASL